MIQTGIESRIKIQEIISNQLPEYVLDESPKALDFLKQYYISQEYQGGPVDIAENLDQYLKVDNLTPEVVVGFTTLSSDIGSDDNIISVPNTKGFPEKYGLLKIDDEIITYTGVTTNTFTGCIRGFSGITSYHHDLNAEELVFSDTTADSHTSNSPVNNLSSLFLKEFYKKLKSTYTPGFENRVFNSEVDAGNFIKESRSFYESKGTNDSFRILFNVLFGETPRIINLEEYLIKPSDAKFIRKEICIAEAISGDPAKIIGQTLTKSTDPTTNASISSVEIFTKDQKVYYKVGLFVGYGDNSNVQGNFIITPNSKVLENVSIGASIISVDSTIGFNQTGIVYSGDNTITYVDKSINQFLGCSGVVGVITATDNIFSDDTYFSYEDGDITKKVVLRLTGVLSNFVQKSDSISVNEGQILGVKSIGTLIENPEQNKTYTEIFANSWIYNTSSSIEIDSFVGGSNPTGVILKTSVDRSQLKKGDRVEFIDEQTNNVIYPTDTSDIPFVNADIRSNLVSIGNLSSFSPNEGQFIKLRRKINKANSSSVDFKYENNSIISDVQNMYVDDDNFAYIASNSLPSWGNGLTNSYAYQIKEKIKSASISSSGSIIDFDIDTGLYSTIFFDTPVPFISGEKVQYTPSGEPLKGLEEGSYYIKIVSNSDGKKIKLYRSPSFLVSDANSIQFKSTTSELETHTFTLYSQKSRIINPQKILKKFSLNPNIKDGIGKETVSGSIGMLINGVEISNYKTFDKVYYGPIENVKVLNGGFNFDVINTPYIGVSTSAGTTSLVLPVITGTVTDIIIDKQDFDIKEVLSINITGGNGSGGSFEPVLNRRRREILFDARTTTQGGGISTTTNQLTFLSNHNITNGQKITYRNSGNQSVVIGLGLSTLSDNANYFAKVDNNTTIQLFNTFDDYLNGNNQISFATTSISGIHKFLTEFSTNTVSEVKIIEGGSFTNRKVLVKPTGISTSKYTINFNNHGFSSGEIVEYSPVVGLGTTQPQTISGLTTTNQYFILRNDEKSFRVCDAGIGGTNTTNYDQNNFVKFSSVGTGFQQFKYPDIKANIEFTTVGIATSTQIQSITATPVVKGSIEEIYVYDPGTGYGSNILNFEKKPSFTIKNGRDAQIVPIIVNGSINETNIQFGGYEYFSTPDLIVSDPTNAGSGAKLRAIVTNERITGVNIVNAGIGYSTSSTIKVIPSGTGEILEASIRELTSNQVEKLNTPEYEILKDNNDELSYSVTGYFKDLQSSFNDTNSTLSNIIGWAYDGNPIYGPYSIVDPENISSGIKTMTSGYTKNVSNVYDRPSISDFPLGFFVEDYSFNNQNGTLDKNNGIFAKTKDFPNGVYAYYASIDAITGEPQFPYFIGNSFRSNTIDENESLNQKFDFDNSSLSRNTLGYKILESNAHNDFIIENNKIVDQQINVEHISEGSISGISVINSGDDYKVNDLLNFNNDDTNGGGIYAKISSLKGRNVDRIDTSYEVYNDAVFTWRGDDKVTITISPFHTLLDKDYVSISGFSTSNLSILNGYYKINVPSISNVGLTTEIVSSGAATTEIYVTQIPSGVSVGSSIGIGTETLEILNVYQDKNVFRVNRSLPGTAHTIGVAVSFKPKTLIIDQKIDYFDSKVNNKVYFNPQESVGFGTVAGIGYNVTYSFGEEVIVGSIPTQRISIKDHPFETNQRLTFNRNGNANISISTSPTGTPFNLPTTVYAVNKSPSTIGIKTSLTSGEVFFISGGDNVDDYYFDTHNTQQLGKVEKILSTVSISTSHYHGLIKGDLIAMNVDPNLSVGIGTSIAVRLKRNLFTNNLQINPIGFNSLGINTISNQINIENHGLETGDKVYYESDSISSGLDTGSYFVYRVNSDNIKLSHSNINANKNPPVVVSIGGTGGSSQTISLINPRIQSVLNNNLVFDLTDSSLEGYSFKLYYDRDFNNEFISTGSTETFSISSVGTIGVTNNASITINNSPGLPKKLYYSLEKSGYISSSDKDVNNFSEILFIDSAYNKTYNVFGIGSTTFQISLQESPEKLTYTSSECDNLEYTTTSISASGPVNDLKLISGGSQYKKLPTLSNVSTVNGTNLSVSLKSDNIGSIKETRSINEKFEYSSDKTLNPRVFISPKIILKDSNTIGIVTITSGGSGYTSPPQIIIINNDTRTEVKNGVIRTEITGNSITNLIIDVLPKGISDQSAELFTVNNTNGISIKQVNSEENSGIFTCILTTPSLGFDEDVFSVNEEVFIEGIQKSSTTGDGFNSSDYGYKFLKVVKYENKLTPGLFDDQVTISIAGLGTNVGVAKTIQDSFGNIIAKKDYPTFSVSLSTSGFEIGETLISNGIERNLKVTDYDSSGSLKVLGTYNLSVNETIVGKSSGNIATIESLINYDGIFEIKFSNRKNQGWEKQTGKLSEDHQVLADNDYYQSLSYSIKSRQQWNDIRTPVNSLVHSIGIKNFADTEIISDGDERVGITSSSNVTTIIRDFTDEKRVDTINNFDFVKDIDLVEDKSKFLELKNKKLTNYQLSISNIGLRIDDIKEQFSNLEDDPYPYTNITKIDDEDTYNNYLFKVSDTSGKNQVQLTSLLFLNNSVNTNKNNIAILEKQSLVNVGSGFTTIDGEQYGDFSIETDEFNDKYIRFTPKDPFNTEYDIKYIDKKFNNENIGVGTTTIGFIDITSRSQEILTGTTDNIIGVSTDKFVSFHVNAQIYTEVTKDMNFVELYVTHDGIDTNISEFYFDTEDFSRSSNLLGHFDSNIDSGSFNLNYTNDTDEDVIVKTHIVGFGTKNLSDSVGIGTFRYRLLNQPEGNERSAIYESGVSTTTSGVSTSFLRLNKNNFDSARSLVEVSIGSTKSIHQVLMVQDTTDIYTQEYSLLSIGSTSGESSPLGVGTFGGEYSGDDILVKFYPDSNFIGDIRINSYSECLYTTVDFINQAPNLIYGNSIETVNTGAYLAINGDRINKKDFVLRSKTTPIFAKSFNPSDANILNLSTGVFSINNHFFSNGEELIYTPKSTFVGVGSTPMMYQNGSTVAELPSKVFAIVDNDNSFSISTVKSGTAVIFTSVGEGNSHEFSMAKRNEKAIITINDVAQYPIIFAKVSQTLSGNGGSISESSTIFSLSGITTIYPLDILRVDDEYMKVVNVGLGTTNIGPISNSGTETLVEVERGFVGSSGTSHTDSTLSRIYKGSYNIVGDKIFFTQSPRGNPNIIRKDNNLVFQTSKFSGRVFLRKNYTTNSVYDDISREFNGIDRKFTLTIDGENTAGIGVSGGNGLVFINGIFQAPTTINNPSNNFSIIEQSTPTGISSIVFSGIRTEISDASSIFISDSDVNQNQIPRGGIIVSLGSTEGIGYAPLAGAAVTAVVGAGGSIVSAGLGITDDNGSGYNGLVSIEVNVVDIEYDHKFVSSGISSITDDTGSTHTATNAVYNSVSGDLTLTILNHGLTTSNTIGIATDGLVFTCSKNSHATNHPYPRAISKTKLRRGESGGDPIHNQQVSIAATTLNTVQINVGPGGGAGAGATISVASIGVGGTLSFNVGSAGTNYVNPEIFVSEPTYENLEVQGISRIGVGATTDTGIGLLVSIDVDPSSVTGIGSTYFGVSNYFISRSGYSFRKGDVFKPVGLVTAKGLTSPISEFKFTVLETFSDNFGSWQFGELDYIDSIKNYQDGTRIRFPLFYTGASLSFETSEDSIIELQNILIVIINGVIQEPGSSYQFTGGSTFSFSVPPKPEDKIDIFFYRGTRNEDDLLVNNIIPTLERGDDIRVFRNDTIPETVTQNQRKIFDVSFADKFETNLYVDQGIDEINSKPLSWTKQKTDRIVNGAFVPKTRQSIISQIYPTAKIIKDITTSDSSIFVDDVSNFNYGVSLEGPYQKMKGIVVDGKVSTAANITSTINTEGLVTSLTVIDGGSGYIYNLPNSIIANVNPSDGVNNDQFGIAVAVGNDKIYVGADYNTTQYGAVYSYNLDGTVQNKITASDTSSGAQFGCSIAVGNDRIIIGAEGKNSNQGVVYIFNLSENQLGIITASDGAAGDYFGYAVAVGSNKIFVGAPHDDDDGTSSGAVYVYNLDGTGEVKITASDAATGDNFGGSVAVGSNEIVVGAAGRDDNGNGSGAVYVYNLDGTGEVKITASDAGILHLFGSSVAVGSNKIIVGSPGESTSGTYSGSVYVYDLDGTNELKITASDAAAGDEFGKSVAVGSNKIIVGAPDDDDNGTSSGSVYIYNLDGTGEIKINAGGSANDDEFGSAVAASNTKIVVGAPGGFGADVTGFAYIYNNGDQNIVDVKFSSPPIIGPGIGTTATATVSIGPDGSLTTPITITNPGFGYTVEPKTITPLPDSNIETVNNIEFIKGFSGIITGITTTSGSSGHSLALKLFLNTGTINFGNDLKVGYPIFVKNTIIGSGVTSVGDSNANVVGIGTTFLDNIYYIHQLSRFGDHVGIVTCNIDSGTDITGLSISGDYVGEFSWGLFTSITRSSTPISIGVTGKTVDVGLSTFPTIQRRGEGLRLTGSLIENLTS